MSGPPALDALGDFLQALVRIPSVNPPGGEGPVARLVLDRLQALGLDGRIVESAPGRANVVAHLAGSGRGPTLLLNGHMDVQPPAADWTRDPFAGERDGTRVYGQGVMDMKAGLAAMLFAVDAVRRTGTRLAGDLVLTAVADEVSGGHRGTGFLVREGLVRADVGVVCEPTGDAVRIAHRGALWLEIEVRGRSAHGGRPWLGVNAISKLARIMRALEDELLPRLATRTHPLVPAPTINLGTIRGGTKFNLVADRATLELDRRLVPGESLDAARAEIEAVCAAVQAADREGFEYRVREVMRVAPAEIAPDAPVVEACRRAYRAVTGREAALAATAGFEDAHFLIEAGIPTAMFGPYRRTAPDEPRFYSASGMPDEWVDLRDVATAAAIYARLILDLLG
ncbi:MAG TPA: ArgE/DapE family deacylase [Methylomirabilota bacterium]|nr:ArgE/DapE family deacylase [Methylomirabilota bacterium]